MSYDWDFSVLRPYVSDFGRGIRITFYLGFASSLIGSFFGGMLGWSLRKTGRFSAALVLNDILRSLPTLFLILAFNYLPWKDLFVVTPPSPFVCALCALTLGQIVFTADLVRGAITNVQPGPILAARALGIPERAIWMHIALPDVLRQVIPAQSAFWVGNFKLSSLASVIGVQEVVFVARVAAGQQFRSLEAWVVVAAIYIVLITPMTTSVRLLESQRWLKRR